MPNFIDSSSIPNSSSVLRRAGLKRESFDPTNPRHLDSLQVFLDTGNWGEVQFYCEVPYTDVPMTVLTRLARHHLAEQRAAA